MDQILDLADNLTDALTSSARHNQDGNPANVVDGLFAIADALQNVAIQLKYLGNGDAATPMGAIEAFGEHMGRKLDEIASALYGGFGRIS